MHQSFSVTALRASRMPSNGLRTYGYPVFLYIIRFRWL